MICPAGGAVSIRLHQRGAEPGVVQHLDRPLRRAVPLEDQHHRPAVAGPALQVVDHPAGLAVVERHRLGGQRQRLALVRADTVTAGSGVAPRLVGRRSACRPRPGRTATPSTTAWPSRPACARTSARPRNAAAPRSIGALPPHGRRGPARLQKLLGGTDQVVRPGADALRVAQQDVGVGRHAVDQQLQRVAAGEQRRRQRLHALDRDALGQLVQDLGQRRVLHGQRRGPLTHGRGEQQLAARRRPHRARPCSMVRWSATAKVRISSTSSPQNSTRSGCSSVGGKTSRMPPRTANSPRLVTRSTRAYAMSVSRRATASSSASAPGAQLDRLEVAEALELRLEQRADRRDDDPQRPCAPPPARCPRRGGPAGAARPAGGRPCRSAARAARAAASPTPGRPPPGPAGSSEPTAAARSSASRLVAVTASTGRPAPPRSPAAATSATTNGRSAAGAVRSSRRPVSPGRASPAGAGEIAGAGQRRVAEDGRQQTGELHRSHSP